ncbi:hypothetical protein AGMMS50268_11600 [Spirochaetia bacterium]|nr:hypothetical protein AGMMS50268_11600 [Spirochaetia bacterium]
MAGDIINKVFSFIGGGSEPVSDKDLLLKQIEKEFSQNKYAKFYRPKTEEVDPAFAAYLYVIYKTVYPAQAFLKDAANVQKLKQISFEHSLSPEVLEMVWRLSPDAIEDRAQKTAPNELARQLQEDFAAVSNAFDEGRISTVNKCYNLITAFSRFVLFDYIGLLQKFDPSLLEGVFTAPTKFTALKGDILVQDLSEFYAVISSLDPADDWQSAFRVMKAVKGGTDVLPPAQWNMLLTNMRELNSSKILEIMIRLVSGNPIWDGKKRAPDEHLSENWFEEKRSEIHERLNGIANNQRSAQMNALAMAIFGEVNVERLKYYSEKGNRVYTQKDLDGFVYAAGLNYLMAFIQDFVQGDIQEICDLVLIRGQWSSNTASLQMSEGFHAILDMIPPIQELDQSLDEKGSNGPRLRGALLRVDRDKTQIRYIGNIIEGIDEEALELIKEAVKHLIVVGKNMKALADDILKKPTELIINWKELDGFSRSPMAPKISESYKKINYFVQLMTLVTHPVE